MKAIVIGAGPAGLAALKELLAAGLDAHCYEADGDLGGVFRYNPSGYGVWEGCRLTSSAMTTAYSDFPPENETPHQMMQDEYWAYLNQYAHHFKLRDRIKFNTRVESVERLADGRWRIEIRDSSRGLSAVEADVVACCTGLHQTPYVPELVRDFAGSVQHSARFKGTAPYRGKRVLVIGAGESGSDIIRMVADVSDRCVLSLRRGVAVIPRMRDGFPIDYFSIRLFFALPPWLARSALPRREVMINRIVTAVLTLPILILLLPVVLLVEGFKSIRLGKKALPLPVMRKIIELMRMSGGSLGDQFLTKSEAFIYSLLNGDCELRGPMAAIEGSDVVFADGHRETFDVILCCTGYEARNTLFADAAPGNLYEGVFSPELGETAAFIGFVRPAIGAIPPIAELQARLFAAVVTGLVKLPSKSAMRAAITQHQFEQRAAFSLNADRMPYLVDYMSYMDELAKLIGCKPGKKTIRADPILFYKFYCAHFLSAQYRLTGPGATPELARKTIKKQPVSYPKPYLIFMLFYLYFSKFMARLGFERYQPRLTVS